MAGDLAVGDRIERRHGPFVATWEVVGLVEAGARLAYVAGTVRFVGHGTPLTNEFDHQPLTEDPAHGFLGRAHWPAANRVERPAPPMPDAMDWDGERKKRQARCIGGGIHAWRQHGSPATGASFSACIACGVTQSDQDYSHKLAR